MDRQRLALLQELEDNPEAYQALIENVSWLRRPIADADWEVPRIVYAQTNLRLTNAQIKAEFQAAKQNAARRLYEPRGEVRECYQNVRTVVEQEGGKALFGWEVGPNGSDPEIGIELHAHSIWQRPDGTLVDITPGLENLRFAPSPVVRSESQALMIACSEKWWPVVFRGQQRFKGMQVTVVNNPMRCRSV